MEDTGTTNTIETNWVNFLGNYKVGKPIEDGALQVFPLHQRASVENGKANPGAALGITPGTGASTEGTAGERPWKLAEELLADGSATVHEVDESGTVSELCFDNQGDAHALLLDGIELRGCKQNRMVNTTILAGAGQKTPIDVSCVEAGRWDYRGRSFSHAGRMVAGSLRNHKAHMVKENLGRHGRAWTDQHEVWQEIDEFLDVGKCESPTRALDDAYDSLSRQTPERKSPVVEGEGAVVAIGGQILGLDLLADRALFAGFWKSASRGYALDAARADTDKSTTAGQVEEWLASLASEARLYPVEVAGVGQHFGVKGSGLSGSVLLHEGDLVHAAVFPELA